MDLIDVEPLRSAPLAALVAYGTPEEDVPGVDTTR